jgi:hypothetical protein
VKREGAAWLLNGLRGGRSWSPAPWILAEKPVSAGWMRGGQGYVGVHTSGKRGFYLPPLVPKLFGPGLKVALVPVRAAGARLAPSPGS